MTQHIIEYHLSQGIDGRKTLTVFDPNDGTIIVPGDNPKFAEAHDLAATAYVYEGELVDAIDAIRDLVSVEKLIEDRPLNAEVKIEDRRVVLSDGTNADPVIEVKILDALRDDDVETYTRLGKFLQSLVRNPSQRSREQLYPWLDRYGFEIRANGSFTAYKGVNRGKSVRSGGAIVNGVPVEGNVPNVPGSVIEISRELVDDDPNAACSTGLHVGSKAFAKSFAPELLEVSVLPSDVVSVPYDNDFAKVRVARYRVIREVL